MADESEEGATVNAVTYKLRKFTETDEVNLILDSIRESCKTITGTESSLENLRVILDRYQEQPHLLDPYLDSFTSKLLCVAQNPSSDHKISSQAFKYLYLFTKVRGSKSIVRLFPHEVQDVEKVLTMLNKQNPPDHESWEARYILLLWLSIVCMVPFDMSRFDGNIAQTSEQKPITERIIDLAKVYLDVVDKCRDAAALVIAKFVTRPDVKTRHLPEFLAWSLERLSKIDARTQVGTNAMTGILSTLALLFKHGKRADLIAHARTVRESVESCNILTLNNSLLRKLYVKLIQRLGLTFLKPRLASWRYKRGTRSLSHNLTKSELENTVITGNQDKENEKELHENFDVPEDIEDIIEILLVGLKEKDTIVRWSAAKGVGRITGRLPKELADDIVGAVLDLFSFQETDSAWHGGCLALAELGRRGLLLPQRLVEVVPVVMKALLYDERRGAISVGSNVRDAACYVCWSFARAYDPVEIKPYIEEIARGLLIATLFDRDINCRRAASAAFQENVGRQGTLPHGIDILTKADYYEVGKRKNTYLAISVYVAQHEEYRQSLIDHLYRVKLGHWDIAIRELVSKALYNLTVRDPVTMAKEVLPAILPLTHGLDLNIRHGSILCAAEITHSLYCYGVENNRSLLDLVGTSCVEGLEQVIPKLTEAKLFRGQGGELMRPAACHFIEKMSLSKFDCVNPETIVIWRNTIDDNLSHLQRPIQEKAVSALHHFTKHFYQMKNGHAVPDIQESLITTYIEKLKHPSDSTREGFTLAFGALPKFMLDGYLLKVIENLLQVTDVPKKDSGKFAQSRADALHSLANIAQAVGVQRGEDSCVINESTLTRLYQCCFKAMDDYTIDSRGDVGSWSRKAAMTCLLKLTLVVTETDAVLLSKEMCNQMMCCLLKQCSEKIDHTRAHAGEIMLKLVHKQNPVIPNIPEHKLLCDVFPREDCENLNWGAATEVFRKVSKLLEIPCYQYAVLSGIILSAGGLSESLIRQAGVSLENFLGRLAATRQDEALMHFAGNLVKLFREFQKNDRVIIPLFKVLDHLLSIGSLNFLAKEGQESIPEVLFDLTQHEIARISDARKIIVSINVFSGLLQFPGNARRKSLQRLLILLCHKFPRVRKATADSLYTAFITYDDIASEENEDEVLSILSETLWEESVEIIRPQRNTLCDLLGVPKPVLKNTSKRKPETSTTQDPLSSYKDLVSRVDY